MASSTIEKNKKTPKKQPIKRIDEALQDVAKGRVHRAKDAQDLLLQCLLL